MSDFTEKDAVDEYFNSETLAGVGPQMKSVAEEARIRQEVISRRLVWLYVAQMIEGLCAVASLLILFGHVSLLNIAGFVGYMMMSFIIQRQVIRFKREYKMAEAFRHAVADRYGK